MLQNVYWITKEEDYFSNQQLDRYNLDTLGCPTGAPWNFYKLGWPWPGLCYKTSLLKWTLSGQISARIKSEMCWWIQKVQLRCNLLKDIINNNQVLVGAGICTCRYNVDPVFIGENPQQTVQSVPVFKNYHCKGVLSNQSTWKKEKFKWIIKSPK